MRALHAIRVKSNVTPGELANMWWHYDSRGYTRFIIRDEYTMMMFDGNEARGAKNEEMCSGGHLIDISYLNRPVPPNFESMITVERA